MSILYNIIWYFHILLESLPISSSGHYTLISRLFKIKETDDSDKYLMHAPSAIAISIFLLNHIDIALEFNLIYLASCVFIANSFTGILYFIFKKYKPNKFPLHLGFIVTASMLIYSKYLYPTDNLYLNYVNSGIIGVFQGIALLPGISRLVSTYFAAILFGINPKLAIYFSLLIELMLILASLVLIFIKKIDSLEVKKITVNFRKFFLISLIIWLSYCLLELMLVLANNNLIYLFGYYMIIPIIISLIIKQ